MTSHFPFPPFCIFKDEEPFLSLGFYFIFFILFYAKETLFELYLVSVFSGGCGGSGSRLVVMMVKKLCFYECFVLCSLLLAVAVSSKNHGNPANDLVDIINKNRTAKRLSQLSNSPGLGCMALQYVEVCKGNCTANNTVNCHPPEDDFTEVYAPNCGVELPTFGTISGHIVGCQHKYLDPSEAFSRVLVQDRKTLSLLQNKTHTEVGVGLIGTHKGSYFWCVLFSSSQTNTTFVLEDLGKGIKQKKGCYSGASVPCSGGQKKTSMFLNNIFIVGFLHIYLLYNSCTSIYP